MESNNHFFIKSIETAPLTADGKDDWITCVITDSVEDVTPERSRVVAGHADDNES